MTSLGSKQTVHVLIKGRVQGVGFRYFTQQRAFEAGISGWVRNLRDGRVEAVGQGTPEEIKQWLSALEKGPSLGRVDSLIVDDNVAENDFSGFEIRATG